MTRHCDVVVFGGCVADTIHRPEDPVLRATTMHGTSNRCTLTTSFGGVGRNVAEACARMGLDVTLVSAVGDDTVGSAILAALGNLGRCGHGRGRHGGGCGDICVDDVQRIKGEVTATYTAILDGSGELCVASAVMAILDRCLSADRLLLSSSRVAVALQTTSTWLVLEGNVPKEDLSKAVRFARQCGRVGSERGLRHTPLLLAYDPISAAKAERAVDALDLLDLIKPNMTEIVVLGKSCGVVDARVASIALRVAEEIDSPAASKKKSRVEGQEEAPVDETTNIVEEWLNAMAQASSSSRNGAGAASGCPLVTLLESAAMSNDVCKLFANTLHDIMQSMLRRFPRLVILCTLGPLGCAVGVGRKSFLLPVLAKSASRLSAPTPRALNATDELAAVFCFPPPDVPKAAIRKVTGAGDSFLSGFIAAVTRVLQAHHASATPLCDMIRVANAAAAEALTSTMTISPHLCPELVERGLSTRGSNRREAPDSKL
jgi:sugar/nucleoside kinase (ribokinase family)